MLTRDDGVGNLIPTQVTSTDQIVEIVAKAARRRLATSGSTSALVEYTIAITKVIYGEMDVVEVQTFEQEYLEQVTTSLAAAMADSYFVEILQADEVFAGASVDVGATYMHLKSATIEAEPVEDDNEEETASTDNDASPKNAGLPLVGVIVGGASLLGAATGAFLVSKYRKRNVPATPEVYTKDTDLVEGP